MLSTLRVLLFIGSLGAAHFAVAEAPLRVLTSIKPLQLIALAVGGDAVHVDALLDPQFSPHDYQLRPSDRAKLNDAAIVFWVGPQLEVFLQQPIKSLSGRSIIISLQDDAADPHIWMDPIAAISIARRMAATFATVRPERRAYFETNGERLATTLVQQDVKHRSQLKRASTVRGFMVSHDAYSRFEGRYGLAHRAALSNAADMPPSAKTLMNIEHELNDGHIACIWRQPQEGKLYQRVISGKNIRSVTIDAMAADVPLDSGGIELFYERLWGAVMNCLVD